MKQISASESSPLALSSLLSRISLSALEADGVIPFASPFQKALLSVLCSARPG